MLRKKVIRLTPDATREGGMDIERNIMKSTA
jgi:hypothetical protein